MSTQTVQPRQSATANPTQQRGPLPENVYKNTFLRSLRSEIRKLTTLKSTWYTLSIWLAMGILITWGMTASLSDGTGNINGVNVKGEFHPIFVTGSSQLYAIFAMVLGALAVTSEYSSNTMRTTIVSQTSRSRAYSAKIAGITVVLGIATAVIIVILTVIALLAGGLSWHGGDGNLRALIFFWLACVLTSLLTTGAGYIFRSTAGAIVTGFVTLILSQLLILIPLDFFRETLPKYLPSGLTAGMTATDTTNPTQFYDNLGPNLAALLWFGYVVVFLVLGFIKYKKADA